MMGAVRFASIKSLISTERACVWTLEGLLDDAQFAIGLKEAEQALKRFFAIAARQLVNPISATPTDLSTSSSDHMPARHMDSSWPN
jgi:hypothetical protein